MNPISTIAVYAPNRLDVPTFKAGLKSSTHAWWCALMVEVHLPANG